jgi:hypothetical protein
MDVLGYASFSIAKGNNIYRYEVPLGSSYEDAIDVLVELIPHIKQMKDKELAAKNEQQAVQPE